MTFSYQPKLGRSLGYTWGSEHDLLEFYVPKSLMCSRHLLPVRLHHRSESTMSVQQPTAPFAEVDSCAPIFTYGHTAAYLIIWPQSYPLLRCSGTKYTC